MAKQFQSVRGMSDILPEQQQLFRYAAATFDRLAAQAGYRPVDTPVVEPAGLFVKGTGADTDIVGKEMYVFTDRSDNELALRPEGTPGIVRAYVEHGLASWPQPVKLRYAGPMFRYDRPQSGRQRQFHQAGVEVFGEASSSADAQVIVLASRLLRQLGLGNASLQINSIGDSNCRPKYRKVLVDYLTEHQKKLSPTSTDRLKANPLRILDSKEAQDQAVIAEAPQMLNYLCKACHAHFTGVLEYLDDLGVGYELNPHLVRGLDYYNRTVFEFFGSREGAQASLGAGGRYDGLVELLGGAPTPAVGFAMGIERIVLELEEAGIQPPADQPVKVFVASLGEPARLAGFKLIEQLLDGGVGAAGAVDKNGIQGQLSRADKLGAPWAIIIGQKEVFDKTVILRDMQSGAQEMIPLEKIVKELQKRFGVN